MPANDVFVNLINSNRNARPLWVHKPVYNGLISRYENQERVAWCEHFNRKLEFAGFSPLRRMVVSANGSPVYYSGTAVRSSVVKYKDDIYLPGFGKLFVSSIGEFFGPESAAVWNQLQGRGWLCSNNVTTWERHGYFNLVSPLDNGTGPGPASFRVPDMHQWKKMNVGRIAGTTYHGRWNFRFPQQLKDRIFEYGGDFTYLICYQGVMSPTANPEEFYYGNSGFVFYVKKEQHKRAIEQALLTLK